MPAEHLGRSDRSRLPSWALSMTGPTQEWLLQLSDDILGDPRLWLVMQRYLETPQTSVALAQITAEVRSMRERA